MTAPVRRLGVFLFWDPSETVENYVKVSLAAVRPYFENLIVVVNGQVDREGQDALAAVADEVWYRENTGFDVGGYKYAVDRLGVEAIAAYDEFVLLNYTFYAPLGDLGAMFDRMDASGVDFWGVTNFKDSKQNFVQSYFIAARSRLTGSQAFADYWAAMPAIMSINDSIEHHEKAFTAFFASKGFSWDVAFPTEAGEFGNVTIASPIQQMADGSPTLKYRAFTFPLESLRHREAPYPARTLEYIRKRTDYDARLIVDHLVRIMSPAAFAANMQTVTVAAPQAASEIAPLGAVGVFLNVVDMAGLEGLAPVLSALAPRGTVTLFVRIPSAEMEAEVWRAVGGNAAEVRVGAPTSTAAALFSWSEEVDFRRFDLVLSLGDFTGGRRINAWLDNRLSFYVDNLVAGDGVLDAVARQFEDASIDMVMSPASPYLEGLDDLFWTKNRFEIRRMAADLGLSELDGASNLHSPHSAFWLRGEAAFALASSYGVVSQRGTLDVGEQFNRLIPALLAARGKIAWRLISARNAAQVMAAAGWMAPQSIEMRIEKDRETERRIAAQLLTNDKLERALKAARTRLSEVNAALEIALGDKRVLESGQETSRLAVAENRELRLLYNRTAEELAELRRAAVGQWAQAKEGNRSRRGVKRIWRWARRQGRRQPT